MYSIWYHCPALNRYIYRESNLPTSQVSTKTRWYVGTSTHVSEIECTVKKSPIRSGPLYIHTKHDGIIELSLVKQPTWKGYPLVPVILPKPIIIAKHKTWPVYVCILILMLAIRSYSQNT